MKEKRKQCTAGYPHPEHVWFEREGEEWVALTCKGKGERRR